MKTTIPKILFVCLFALVLFSCNSTDNEITPPSASNISSRISEDDAFLHYREDDEIVLGHQRHNPYEIHTMLEAYDLLHEYVQNFVVGAIEPYVNNIYYRVLPRDSSELAILSSDPSVIYFDYPLDYDIERWGSFYHDPSLGNFDYTWLYAVVPANHPLPHLSTLEILAECYIPNEPVSNDGHYEEIPDWRNGFAMLEYMAYKLTNNLDMYDSEVIAAYEEILLETSSRNMIQASQFSTDIESRNLFWDFIAGVHPEGDFYVENTYGGSQGIKNASVFIHNIVKIYCGPLNSQGHYYSTMRFRTHCWYHIRFENNHTLTRIYGGAKFLIGPVHRHLAWYSRYGYSCTLDPHDVAWRYASINNAVEEYFDYCNDYNILFPYYMRVWVCGIEGDWAGGTPLLHKRHSPLIYNSLVVSILGPLFLFLDIPDMALFISQNSSIIDTYKIYGLIFHEFSHASHYEKVGNNYWSNYVLHIILNMGYGTHAGGPFHGYCGIGEMWGNFAEAHFLYKHMGFQYPYIYLTSSGAFDYSQYANLPYYLGFSPHEDWYNPGILAKIHQDSHCSITDIYNALNPNVNSLETLRASLHNQGIGYEIIDQAYEAFHSWE